MIERLVVYYFVIGADGGRYGPADIDSLVTWAREGRLVGSTILVERGTERELRADSITAIAAALRDVSGEGAAVVIEREDAAPPDVPAGGWEPGPKEPFPDSPGRAVPPIPPIPRAEAVQNLDARRKVVGSKSKVVAGLLGIFLGGLGVHRFYLGYTGIGLLMLGLCVLGGFGSFFCIPGSGCGIVGLWGFVEGVICLCGGMRDANGLELRD